MSLRRLAAGTALIATVACSAPPEKERHQAEGAIAAAREAGAALYARTDLETAENALQKYDAAVAQRDYRQALSLAVEARDTAYQAAKRAADGKSAARAEADRLLLDAEQTLQDARAHLRSPGASPRLRALATAVETAMQDARSAAGSQDYHGAVSALKSELEALRTELDSTAPRRSK